METNVQALSDDPTFTAIVEAVARKQMKRRRRAYDEIAISSPDDLSQELWLSLLLEQSRGRLVASFVSSEEAFREYVISLSEVIAQRGVRKSKHGHSIPVGRLTRRDKAKLWHKRGYSLEATFDELFERQEYWS